MFLGMGKVVKKKIKKHKNPQSTTEDSLVDFIIAGLVFGCHAYALKKSLEGTNKVVNKSKKKKNEK
jgi:hypothetical protein